MIDSEDEFVQWSPNRSEAERAAQRIRLIKTAMDAVRAGGGDVSVADIADSAGVSKPVLYAEFGDKNGIIRSIRSEDRGLVDNALARVVRQRAEVLVRNLGIEVPTDVLTIMIDGLFGFALSAIESWQSVGSPSQDEFSAGLADVAVASIVAIGSRYSATPTTPETAETPVLIAGQVEDGAVVLGEDGFGVWVLMLGVQGFGWGGRLEGQAVVSLTACRAEDSSTMPVLAA